MRQCSMHNIRETTDVMREMTQVIGFQLAMSLFARSHIKS